MERAEGWDEGWGGGREGGEVGGEWRGVGGERRGLGRWRGRGLQRRAEAGNGGEGTKRGMTERRSGSVIVQDGWEDKINKRTEKQAQRKDI